MPPTARAPSTLLSRRQLLRTAGAGAAGALLAGCGGGGTDPSTVTQWNGWTGVLGIEAQRRMATAFNRAHPDLRVRQTGYPWDTLFSKLPLAAAAGNPPRVAVLHITEIPQYADLGILRPLDDLVEAAGPDLSVLPPAAVESCSYQGRLYAVPGDQHPFALWYNTDLVAAAGLDPGRPPTDQAEFLHWVRALTVTEGDRTTQYGFQLPFRGSTIARWFFHTILHQLGGSFFDEDVTRCTVDSPAGREALGFVVDLVRSGMVATGGSEQDPISAGQVAMWVSGSWELALRVQEGLPFATAEMPRFGPERAVWANSHCLALADDQSDAAAEASMTYAKFFYDNYAIPAATVGFIPVNPVARADERLTSLDHFDLYEPFIQALDYTALEPKLVRYTQLFSFGRPTPVNDNIEAALDGRMGVTEALSDMQRRVNEVLEV